MRCEQQPSGQYCWAAACDCAGCTVGQTMACTCGADPGVQNCTKSGTWGSCMKDCALPNPDGGLDLPGKAFCTPLGTWSECTSGCPETECSAGQVADPDFGCGCFDAYRENIDCTNTGLAPGAAQAFGIRVYQNGAWRWQNCQPRSCLSGYTLQGAECVQCQTADQCGPGEDLIGCLCQAVDCPPDELICQCEADVCISASCGPEFCLPANGCEAKNPAEFEASCSGGPVEEEKCTICHTGLEKAHVPFLSCVECHGGDASTVNVLQAHVAKPAAMASTWNSTDPVTGTYFNYLTHVGLEDERFDDPATPSIHEGLAWLKFSNPADLRVGGQTCGKEGCHTTILGAVTKSVMGTSAGVIGGAHYALGLGRRVNGLPIDTEAARLASVAARTTPLLDEGMVSEPNFPTGTARELAPYPTAELRDIGDSSDEGLAAMLEDTIDKACASCHVGSKGANRRAGDFRSAGCSACHVLYEDDGVSRSADASILKTEPYYDPSNPGVADAYTDIMLKPGQRPHPYQHRLTRKLPSRHCAHCHNESNWTVMQFKGQRPDPNGDLQATFGCQEGGNEDKCRYDNSLVGEKRRHGLKYH